MITLATLAEATAQEVFDQVVTHMIKQGQPCTIVKEGTTLCVYRNPEGLKCAAGALIADSEYKPEMDDNNIGSGWEDLVHRELVPDTKHTNLIARLQSVHDGFDPQYWEMRLQRVAIDFGLTYNFPTHV